MLPTVKALVHHPPLPTVDKIPNLVYQEWDVMLPKHSPLTLPSTGLHHYHRGDPWRSVSTTPGELLAAEP